MYNFIEKRFFYHSTKYGQYQLELFHRRDFYNTVNVQRAIGKPNISAFEEMFVKVKIIPIAYYDLYLVLDKGIILTKDNLLNKIGGVIFS